VGISQDPRAGGEGIKKGNNMSNLPSLEELLKKGVHFGHKTSKRHPKMIPFIFSKRNGVHVLI